jgi:hypothetical protein
MFQFLAAAVKTSPGIPVVASEYDFCTELEWVELPGRKSFGARNQGAKE